MNELVDQLLGILSRIEALVALGADAFEHDELVRLTIERLWTTLATSQKSSGWRTVCPQALNPGRNFTVTATCLPTLCPVR